ncbi:MAG: hypothetical protein KUG73_07855 [Pseudomonadales bacterium]|nr:hypothetical protein [Pseudomonadales bacterium]
MGHLIVILGTFIAFNFGVGHTVADNLYEDEMTKGVVEVQERALKQSQ